MRKPKRKKRIKFRKQKKKERSQKSVGTPVFTNFMLSRPDQRAFPKREIGRDLWVAESIV